LWIWFGSAEIAVASCPAGRFASNSTAVALEGVEACELCPIGRFREAKTDPDERCTAAPAGSFVPTRGATFAVACPLGTYTVNSSSASCDLCAPGSVGNGTNATECFAASRGRYAAFWGMYDSEACPAGRFAGAEGASVCSACPEGTVSASNGSASCASCAAGSRADAGRVACVSASGSGDGGGNATVECPAGSAPSGDEGGCVQCGYGYFSRNGSVCEASPPGYIVSVRGAVEAQPCPAGEVAAHEGLSECTACGPATFSPAGSAECFACPVGGGARCEGGRLFLEPGYWVPPQLTRRATDLGRASGALHQCPVAESCLMELDLSANSLVVSCAEGYEGVLCAQCAPGFARAGADSRSPCQRCWEPAWLNTLTTAVFGLLGLAVASILIWRSQKPKSDLTALFRIAVNYTQVSSMLLSFSLRGPDSFAAVMGWTSVADGITTGLLPVRCSVHFTFLASLSTLALLPFLAAVLVLLVVAALYIRTIHRSAHIRRRLRRAFATKIRASLRLMRLVRDRHRGLPASDDDDRDFLKSNAPHASPADPHLADAPDASLTSPMVRDRLASGPVKRAAPLEQREGGGSAGVLLRGVSSRGLGFSADGVPEDPTSWRVRWQLNECQCCTSLLEPCLPKDFTVPEWRLRRRIWRQYFFFWAAGTIVVLFVLYAQIAKTVAAAFRCYEIPALGVSVLLDDVSVTCWSRTHLVGVVVAALAGAVFIVGFPVFIIQHLHRNRLRGKLEKPRFRRTWGFLYAGLQLNTWYGPIWEAIIMVRKAVIIAIASFVSDAFLQVFFGAATMALALSVQTSAHPYSRRLLNWLEILSLASTLTSMMFSIVYWRQVERLAAAGHADHSSADRSIYVPMLIVTYGTFFLFAAVLVRAFVLRRITLSVRKRMQREQRQEEERVLLEDMERRRRKTMRIANQRNARGPGGVAALLELADLSAQDAAALDLDDDEVGDRGRSADRAPAAGASGDASYATNSTATAARAAAAPTLRSSLRPGSADGPPESATGKQESVESEEREERVERVERVKTASSDDSDDLDGGRRPGELRRSSTGFATSLGVVAQALGFGGHGGGGSRDSIAARPMDSSSEEVRTATNPLYKRRREEAGAGSRAAAASPPDVLGAERQSPSPSLLVRGRARAGASRGGRRGGAGGAVGEADDPRASVLHRPIEDA
jgi:hypothetical protein